MSRTIEATMAHLVPPTKRQAARAQTGQLIAEWQEGPETISGYAPRKLRLSFPSRKFVTPAQLRTSHFPLPTFLATLGFSAKEERI